MMPVQRTVKYRYPVGMIVVAEGEFTQVHAGGILIEVRFPEGGQPELYVDGLEARPFSEHPANSTGKDASA